jgi:hypothetical protein
LTGLIGGTPSSVPMKLVDFASRDYRLMTDA